MCPSICKYILGYQRIIVCILASLVRNLKKKSVCSGTQWTNSVTAWKACLRLSHRWSEKTCWLGVRFPPGTLLVLPPRCHVLMTNLKLRESLVWLQVTCRSFNKACKLKLRSNTCYCCYLYNCERWASATQTQHGEMPNPVKMHMNPVMPQHHVTSLFNSKFFNEAKNCFYRLCCWKQTLRRHPHKLTWIMWFWR